MALLAIQRDLHHGGPSSRCRAWPPPRTASPRRGSRTLCLAQRNAWSERQIAAMVGVCGRPGCNGARQVAGCDRVHGRATDAHLPILRHAARPHVAVLAADARLPIADGARLEIRRATERGRDARQFAQSRISHAAGSMLGTMFTFAIDVAPYRFVFRSAHRSCTGAYRNGSTQGLFGHLERQPGWVITPSPQWRPDIRPLPASP